MKPSMQIPWYVAKAIRIAISPMIIALEFQGAFWKTWGDVYGN